MQTARVNYVGSSDVEYTEIRPIRPNQSVVLAGLGVTGSKVGAWRKDRGYRSSQGAGYSDGLVIHSALNTRPSTQPAKIVPASNKKGSGRSSSSYQRYPGDLFSRNSTSFTQYTDTDRKYSMITNYDPTDSRGVVFDMQALPPVPSTSPPYTSPSHPSYLLTPTPGNTGKNTGGTYDMFFEQHLHNIVNIEEDPTTTPALSASPGTARTTPGAAPSYREASCQTPTDLRISPLIPARLTNTNTDRIARIVEEECQTGEENQGEKEEGGEDKASYRESEEVSDDELSMIGDFMVKESLDEATAIYDDPMQVIII